jgi:hypothetical protein
MPDDRVQVIETYLATNHADIGMEWDYCMAALIFSPRETHVAYDADEAPARNQEAKDFPPNFL